MMSIADLERELRRRKRAVKKVHRQRVQLLRQLKKIDRAIAKIGGGRAGATGSAGGNGARPKNEKSLTETLQIVLKSGEPMKVGDIVAETQKRYQSNSTNFRQLVNQTLGSVKTFKRAGRGVYQLTATKGA